MYVAKLTTRQLFCQAQGFADGEIVTEDKVCLWLQEDILKRVTTKRGRAGHLPKGQQKRKAGELEDSDDEDLPPPPRGPGVAKTAEKLASEFDIPAVELFQMLEEGLEAEDEEEKVPGRLLSYSTLNVYLAGVAEIQKVQVSNGLNKHPYFRGAGVEGLLKDRKSSRSRRARELFEDKGIGGLDDGYNAKSFMQMQQQLLNSPPGDAAKVCSRLPVCSTSPALRLANLPPSRTFGPASTSLPVTTSSSAAITAGSSSSPTARYWIWVTRVPHPALVSLCRLTGARRTKAGRRSSRGPSGTKTLCSVRWAPLPSTSFGALSWLGSLLRTSGHARAGTRPSSCWAGSLARSFRTMPNATPPGGS
jgi:hypothetical protein